MGGWSNNLIFGIKWYHIYKYFWLGQITVWPNYSGPNNWRPNYWQAFLQIPLEIWFQIPSKTCTAHFACSRRLRLHLLLLQLLETMLNTTDVYELRFSYLSVSIFRPNYRNFNVEINGQFLALRTCNTLPSLLLPNWFSAKTRRWYTVHGLKLVTRVSVIWPGKIFCFPWGYHSSEKRK